MKVTIIQRTTCSVKVGNSVASFRSPAGERSKKSERASFNILPQASGYPPRSAATPIHEGFRTPFSWPERVTLRNTQTTSDRLLYVGFCLPFSFCFLFFDHTSRVRVCRGPAWLRSKSQALRTVGAMAVTVLNLSSTTMNSGGTRVGSRPGDSTAAAEAPPRHWQGGTGIGRPSVTVTRRSAERRLASYHLWYFGTQPEHDSEARVKPARRPGRGPAGPPWPLELEFYSASGRDRLGLGSPAKSRVRPSSAKWGVTVHIFAYFAFNFHAYISCIFFAYFVHIQYTILFSHVPFSHIYLNNRPKGLSRHFHFCSAPVPI